MWEMNGKEKDLQIPTFFFGETFSNNFSPNSTVMAPTATSSRSFIT